MLRHPGKKSTGICSGRAADEAGRSGQRAAAAQTRRGGSLTRHFLSVSSTFLKNLLRAKAAEYPVSYALKQEFAFMPVDKRALHAV
jgi:hypothetical protein